MTASTGRIPAAIDNQPEGGTRQAVAPAGGILEMAIQRLESSGASRNIHEAADSLRVMGYELRLAKTTVPGKRPENYLRIMNPAYRAHGIGYLTPTMFSFSRAIDRERLARLPGAIVANSSVNFTHVDSAQPGLAAARLLKEGPQDREPNKPTSTPQEASSTTSPRHAASGEVHVTFGNVQATANNINQAITWLMNTTGGHETFTAAMESRENPLADWAKNGYQGLKTWSSPKPPQKPQIADYLRQALAAAQEAESTEDNS
jgi:hypothetical protein